MATTLRRARNALLWLILGLLAALALAIVVVPRVMGWVPLTILTGSMEPTIPTGSQVVVEPVEGDADAQQLQIGDVVTFMPYPDDPTLVTHRIVSRSIGTDGSVSFTTQGDANGAADPWELTATQLRGEVRYHVPYAGHVATMLDGNQKSAGIVVVAALLFGYAALQLVTAARDARRPKPGTSSDEVPTADPAEQEGQPVVDRAEEEVHP